MSPTVQTQPQFEQEARGVHLTAETRLRIAPGVRTRIDAAGHVIVDSLAGPIVDVGPRGFAALSLFSPPAALGDVIDGLADEAAGSLPTISVINALIEEGVLVEVDGDPGAAIGWADPVEQGRMLDDTRRTHDYLAAIARAVRPGDVVLEIGTGSGILAVAAARAGAKRVYAVEASDIADTAERVFAVNGVADRVTLIAGWSRHIELPEHADVLVSEIIGSEPFEEEILETTLDARRRLLQPGARLVPGALTLMARPLLVPPEQLRQHAIGRDDIERWRRLYDVDLHPLLDCAASGPVYTPVLGEVVSRWPAVGPATRLTTVDLATFRDVSIQASADLTVHAAGPVNAVAVTFRASLFGSIAHTLDPWQWPSSSWSTSVWVFPEEIEVGPSSVLRVHYDRRTPGKPDGLSCEVVTTETNDRRQ